MQTPTPPAFASPSAPVSTAEPQVIVVRTAQGVEHTIELRPVPLGKFGTYLEKIGDILAFVEFVTGKEEGFADRLAVDDLFTLDAAARAMNSERLGRYLRRQAETDAYLRQMVAKHSA